MIDLGDLAYETNNLMWGEAQTLDHALKFAVTYNVHGAYRKWSTGLSCFYPYSNQASDLRNYMSQKAAPLPQKCLYSYFMYGQMPQEGRQLLAGEKPAVLFPASVIDEKPGFGIFNVSALEDTPVHVDNDGSAFVELTQKQMDQISSVRCHLAYISEEDDVIIDLGSDANIIAGHRHHERQFRWHLAHAERPPCLCRHNRRKRRLQYVFHPYHSQWRQMQPASHLSF